MSFGLLGPPTFCLPSRFLPPFRVKITTVISFFVLAGEEVYGDKHPAEECGPGDHGPVPLRDLRRGPPLPDRVQGGHHGRRR